MAYRARLVLVTPRWWWQLSPPGSRVARWFWYQTDAPQRPWVDDVALGHGIALERADVAGHARVQSVDVPSGQVSADPAAAIRRQIQASIRLTGYVIVDPSLDQPVGRDWLCCGLHSVIPADFSSGGGSVNFNKQERDISCLDSSLNSG